MYQQCVYASFDRGSMNSRQRISRSMAEFRKWEMQTERGTLLLEVNVRYLDSLEVLDLHASWEECEFFTVLLGSTWEYLSPTEAL